MDLELFFKDKDPRTCFQEMVPGIASAGDYFFISHNGKIVLAIVTNSYNESFCYRELSEREIGELSGSVKSLYEVHSSLGTSKKPSFLKQFGEHIYGNDDNGLLLKPFPNGEYCTCYLFQEKSDALSRELVKKRVKKYSDEHGRKLSLDELIRLFRSEDETDE